MKTGCLIALNEKAIEQDAQWDGFHGLAVSNSAQLTVGQALARYRNLWHIEEAFRVAKCTLKRRSIFHWVPHRIRSHVLLCFTNLFLGRFLEMLLRQNKTPLAPDRIQHATPQIHTTYFEDTSTGRAGKMQSVLCADAKEIFQSLQLEVARNK